MSSSGVDAAGAFSRLFPTVSHGEGVLGEPRRAKHSPPPFVFHNLLPRVQGVPPGTHQQTHLQVKELAVASVDDLRAAIAPEHLDDIDLAEEARDRMSPRW